MQAQVANGASMGGVAGAGTSILAEVGYDMLGPKNSSKQLEVSTVYYVDGYAADAEVIAALLNIPIENTAPMPPDPGVSPGSANVIVVLGADVSL